MTKKKIGILTHFSSFDNAYALAVGWLERARMLDYFDQDFDFLVQENCSSDIYPHIKKVLRRCKSGTFKEKVRQMEDCYKNVLKPYDCILTADVIYQRKGDFLVWNQAMRNVAPQLKAKWFHWIHSGWVSPTPGVQHPESLRFTYMPDSKLVYMNNTERDGIAKMYRTTMNNTACVYNPKDIRSFYGFDSLSWQISKQMNLMEKDVVQIFPHCSTRMESKGIDPIIWMFSALKKKGLKVGLVFANSHISRGATSKEVEVKKRHITNNFGLIEGQDFIFTSDLLNGNPLPRKCVADLFLISNLFVFASYREVCPNILLEAKSNPNILLVINACNRTLIEFSGKGHGSNPVIYFDATAKVPGVNDGKSGDISRIKYNASYYDHLAQQVINHLPSRKYLQEYSFENIWKNQMEPLLYGNIETKNV